MQIILFNLDWMSFNILLAMIPMVFGWLLIKTHASLLKIIFGSIWFVFLPNTIYLLTDIAHFFNDWHLIPFVYKGLFVAQYIVLMLFGIISFILAMYPIEKLIKKTKSKKKQQQKDFFIYILNFLIGFGIVLGRIERLNSWDIITDTSKVIYQSIHTLTSLPLISLVIFFGLFSNGIYFSLRKIIIKNFKYL